MGTSRVRSSCRWRSGRAAGGGGVPPGAPRARNRAPWAPRPLARLPKPVPSEIVVSDDAGRYAYVEGPAGEMRVVHDGVQDDRYLGAGWLAFSPVTRRLFYWAQSKPDRGFLVADGTKIGDFG